MWLKRVLRLIRTLLPFNWRANTGTKKAKVPRPTKHQNYPNENLFSGSILGGDYIECSGQDQVAINLVSGTATPRTVSVSSRNETSEGSKSREISQQSLPLPNLAFLYCQNLLWNIRAVHLLVSLGQIYINHQTSLHTPKLDYENMETQYSPTRHSDLCSTYQSNPSNNADRASFSKQVDDYHLQIYPIEPHPELIGLPSEHSSVGNLMAGENVLSEAQGFVVPIGHTVRAQRENLLHSINSDHVYRNSGTLIQKSGAKLKQYPSPITGHCDTYGNLGSPPEVRTASVPNTRPPVGIAEQIEGNSCTHLSSLRQSEQPHVIQMTHTIAVRCLSRGEKDLENTNVEVFYPSKCCPCDNQESLVNKSALNVSRSIRGGGIPGSYMDRSCQTSCAPCDTSHTDCDARSELCVAPDDISAETGLYFSSCEPANCRDEITGLNIAAAPVWNSPHKLSRFSMSENPSAYGATQLTSPNRANCCDLCLPWSAHAQEVGRQSRVQLVSIGEPSLQSPLEYGQVKTNPVRLSDMESLSRAETSSLDMRSQPTVPNSTTCCGVKNLEEAHPPNDKYLGQAEYPMHLDGQEKRNAVDDEETPCYFCFRRRRRSRVAPSEIKTDSTEPFQKIERTPSVYKSKQICTPELMCAAHTQPNTEGCRCHTLGSGSKHSLSEVHQEPSIPVLKVTGHSNTTAELNSEVNRVVLKECNGISRASDRHSVRSIASDTSRPVKVVRFDSPTNGPEAINELMANDKTEAQHIRELVFYEAKQNRLQQIGYSSAYRCASCTSDTVCSKTSLPSELIRKGPPNGERDSEPLNLIEYRMAVEQEPVSEQRGSNVDPRPTCILPPQSITHGRPNYGDHAPICTDAVISAGEPKNNPSIDRTDELECETMAEYVDTVQTASEANQLLSADQRVHSLTGALNMGCGCCVCCAPSLSPTCIHIQHITPCCPHRLSSWCACHRRAHIPVCNKTCGPHGCIEEATMQQTRHNTFSLNHLYSSLMRDSYEHFIPCAPTCTY